VTIAALRHPNIVTVHAVEHHAQLHFFVLDFVEGGSLERVLGSYGPLPIPATMAWLAQMAAALDYAHRRNVIHRDIKPGNILLDTDGNAIVTDFGIAKVAEKSGLTQTGTTMGTPSYMSPEQCLARPVGPPSDQYSLGILAYEMLTGAPPFGGSALEVMRAHTDLLPAPIAARRPDCPAALAAVIERMLEKDPAARWPTLADAMNTCGASLPGLGNPVWQQLAGLARGDASVRTVGSAATPTTPLPGRPVPPPRVRPRRAGLVVGAGVLAVAATIGTVMLTGRSEDASPPAATLPAAATLDLPPVTDPLLVNDEVQLTATLRDSAGEALATPTVRWTSGDAAVATVTDGMVHAHAPGRTTITARSDGLAATVAVEVVAPPPDAGPSVARIRVSPDAVTLTVGATRRLEAVALDAAGAPVEGHALRWTTGNPAVAAISRDGVVTARGGGTTTVTAAAGGRRGAATVTVGGAVEAVASVVVTPDRLELEVGHTALLSAIVTGTAGSRLTRAATWTSTDTDVAAVSGDGRVTARAAGVAIVTATVDGRPAPAAVTVREGVPVVSDADAARLIRQWAEGFATRLDQAIRARDLTAVRRAYQTDLAAGDQAEWQRRLALDARWQARLARTYPARRVGGTWVSDFEITIVVEASGRRQETDQRFLAVFALGAGGGIEVTSLEMRLADQ
jgi:serine/threonine-protein kinase